MMYKVPSQIRIWGAFVIVFSVLSILEMGGFLIGGILGIIGGIMAMANKQSKFWTFRIGTFFLMMDMMNDMMESGMDQGMINP